ncbi:hypothetical protein [Bosea sp. 685]|uniref:hypothetical protein n=1 Tax=Bosea sp. 685 TaxID=3080057 RepID=UPI002892E162|nr:hypothetical protein [Bosea sp. 685]WNJ88599.1 hypothetical protein RMR04_19565 [Bosea sp. 685]
MVATGARQLQHRLRLYFPRPDPVCPRAFGLRLCLAARQDSTRIGSDDDLVRGLDADFSLDEAGHRGLIAGLALTYVTVNSGPGQLQPLYGGYVGVYHQWEAGWKLTGKAGYATFGGGNLGTVIRATPVRQVFATLEFEKYDAADNKMFGLGLAGALSRSTTGKTSTSVQLVLSVPLYLARKR